jgi:hypothetical protein
MEAVSQLAEPQLEGALLYLRAMAGAGSWPSLVAADIDDEPYGEREMGEDAETLGRLERAKLLTTEQLSRELGL